MENIERSVYILMSYLFCGVGDAIFKKKRREKSFLISFFNISTKIYRKISLKKKIAFMEASSVFLEKFKQNEIFG